VPLDQLDLKDPRVHRELMESLETLVNQVPLELMALPDRREIQDLRAIQEHLDSLGQ